MKGCLSAGIAIAILVGIGIYSAFPHPTDNEATLRAVAFESRSLLKTHPTSTTDQSVDVPKSAWPASIASLKPYSVIVRPGMVDITTKPFFDGGWGYGFTADKRQLTMLVECWSELRHNVYWHGPC